MCSSSSLVIPKHGHPDHWLSLHMVIHIISHPYHRPLSFLHMVIHIISHPCTWSSPSFAIRIIASAILSLHTLIGNTYTWSSLLSIIGHSCTWSSSSSLIIGQPYTWSSSTLATLAHGHPHHWPSLYMVFPIIGHPCTWSSSSSLANPTHDHPQH